MKMEPPEHVKLLIEDGTITEAQWLLYRLAEDALAAPEPLVGVTLYAGSNRFGASKLGLDLTVPGIIFASRPDGDTTYIDWSTLSAVNDGE